MAESSDVSVRPPSLLFHPCKNWQQEETQKQGETCVRVTRRLPGPASSLASVLPRARRLLPATVFTTRAFSTFALAVITGELAGWQGGRDATRLDGQGLDVVKGSLDSEAQGAKGLQW